MNFIKTFIVAASLVLASTSAAATPVVTTVTIQDPVCVNRTRDKYHEQHCHHAKTSACAWAERSDMSPRTAHCKVCTRRTGTPTAKHMSIQDTVCINRKHTVYHEPTCHYARTSDCAWIERHWARSYGANSCKICHP